MTNYPDPEQLLCDWLAAALPTGPTSLFRRWVTEMPANLVHVDLMPCVVVSRFGGADPVPGLDDVHVDVDVYTFGPDPMQARAAALARAEDIRHTIRTRLPGAALGVGGPVVSRVRVISAPTIRPYDSRNQVRRAQAAYQVRIHTAL